MASLDEVRDLFGSEVATLVDGVTKVSKITFSSRAEKQAENFRKMVIAMAHDIRVVLIKLADRLHNMRTLSHLARDRQEEISHETLEIYAPIAHRLGIYWLKSDLEDAAFRYTNPTAYADAQGARRAHDGRERGLHQRGHRDHHPAPGGGRGQGRGHRAAQEHLFDPSQDAGRGAALRTGLRPGRLPHHRRHGARMLRGAGRGCMPIGNRFPAASRTTSRCPRSTCTSRCTPR